MPTSYGVHGRREEGADVLVPGIWRYRVAVKHFESQTVYLEPAEQPPAGRGSSSYVRCFITPK